MIFFGNRKVPDKQLSEEQKIMTAEAEAFLHEIQEKNNRESNALIYKLQVRDELQNLEKAVQAFKKNPDASRQKNLENAVIRLKTVSEHLLG